MTTIQQLSFEVLQEIGSYLNDKEYLDLISIPQIKRHYERNRSTTLNLWDPHPLSAVYEINHEWYYCFKSIDVDTDEYEIPDDVRHVQFVPNRDIGPGQFDKDCLAHLTTLESLSLGCLQIKGELYLPPTLTALYLDDFLWCSSKALLQLPNQLQVLHLGNSKYTQTCFDSLPTCLTWLDIGKYPHKLPEPLPSGLKTLITSKYDFLFDQPFPASLTYLDASHYRRTRMPDFSETALPQLKTLKLGRYYDHNFHLMSLTQTLTRLDIRCVQPRVLDALCKLPSLQILNIRTIQQGRDPHYIPFIMFPPHLTVLRVYNNELLKMFDLPKHLHVLELDQFEGLLPLLPNTLEQLTIWHENSSLAVALPLNDDAWPPLNSTTCYEKPKHLKVTRCFIQDDYDEEEDVYGYAYDYRYEYNDPQDVEMWDAKYGTDWQYDQYEDYLTYTDRFDLYQWADKTYVPLRPLTKRESRPIKY